MAVKEGVELAAPASAEEAVSFEESAEDLTPQSEEGVPAAEDAPVDDKGVSLENRVKEADRRVEMVQREKREMFEALKESLAAQNQAVPAAAVDPMQVFEDAGVPSEVVELLDKRYGGVLKDFRENEIVPRETLLVDRTNEEAMARMVETDQFAAAKPYMDEARALLADTAPALRADPRAPAAALTNAMANHLPEILKATEDRARKEAAKNMKILSETNSGGTFTLPGGGSVEVTNDEKNAIEFLKGKGVKVDAAWLETLDQKKVDYDGRKDLEHTLPNKKRR